MRLLVAFSVFLLAVPASLAEPAATFLETCGGCHTVGGGDLAGPDLTAAIQWPRNDLRAAVERMQEYAGPLTPQLIDELTDLLKNPSVRERLKPKPKGPSGSPRIGQKLFFGEQQLANGGLPCFACHTAGGRGGSLAADLTLVHQRMGETPLLAATEKPNFPLMKTAYASHPVTSKEAAHLAAFFAETAKSPQPRGESVRAVHGAAAGVAVVLIGAVAFLFRPRR